MFELIRRLKNFYWRGKRGWSEEDAWDIDAYLVEVIPPIVRKYKDEGSGCPGELYDKSRKNDECWRWKEILEEIAQGFEASAWIKDMKYMRQVKNPNGSYSYEEDKKVLEEMSKKAETGLQLFAKWFPNLWD